MKKLVATISLLSLLTLNVPTAFADYVGTTPQPGQVLTVTKTIQDPKNNEFKKNLTVSDTHLLPGNDVLFRVQIKNISSSTLNNILVTDTLPNSLTYVSSSENLSQNGNTLTETLSSLNAGDTKTIDIHAKVKPANQLPNDTVNCQDSNFVKAEVNGTSPSDTAGFCFENKVLGVTTELPKTGVSDTEYILLASAGLMGAAFFAWKKSKALMQSEY